MLRHLAYPLVITVVGVISLVVACRHWNTRPDNESQLGTPDPSFSRGMILPANRSMLAAPVVLVSFGCFLIVQYLASEKSLTGFETIFQILEYAFFVTFVVSAVLTFSLIFFGVPKSMIPERFRNG